MKPVKTDNESNLIGKIPPQAIDTEMAVLGALLLESDALGAVSHIIDEASFYRMEHRLIFSTIKGIAAKGKPVDMLIVTRALADGGKLEEVGGPLYITRLTSNVASAAHIEHHARIIAEKYYQRETISKATELINLAYSGEDVDVLSSKWKSSGENLEDVFTIVDTGSHIREVLKTTVHEIERDCQRVKENRTPGIPTGFKQLDGSTGGWKPGNLIILAARPGVGKTSFALHFSMIAARAGYWVNIYSLEMNKEDLTRIVLAKESGVYRSDIRDGYLKQSDWDKLNSAITEIEKLPILFKDAAGMTVEQIRASIHQNRKNGRCDFAMVDYMQLVKSSQNKAIRELEVSEISRTLKTAALAENIPILALSQLNREADNQPARLSHLRESGAIEQDADLVIFLSSAEGKIRLSVAKHRRGKTGEMDVYPNSDMTQFSDEPDRINAMRPDEWIESKNDEPF